MEIWNRSFRHHLCRRRRYGNKFEKEEIVWNIKGEDYTLEEMKTDFQTHWAVTEPEVLKLKKEGGLAQGFHDITYGFCFTSSYMPPIIQDHLDPDEEPFVLSLIHI